MPYHAFEKMLQVVWKHLPKHGPGDLHVDGTVCTEQDRLQAVRMWYDTAVVAGSARQTPVPAAMLTI
jgi:hypothetical protein